RAVLGPAGRRAGRILCAVAEHVAAGTGRALLRPARRRVLLALSGAPADVSAGALDHRALVRFFGSAVALCGHRLRRGDRRLGRLLSGVRAADHARAATAVARGANTACAVRISAGMTNSGPNAKPVSLASGLASRGASRISAEAIGASDFAAAPCISHTAMNAPRTRS